MKTIYTLLFLLLSFSGVKAQGYFLGDMQVHGDSLAFFVRAVGTINDGFDDMEFLIRWDKVYGNAITFGGVKNNTDSFPGLDVKASVPVFVNDPNYYSMWFHHLSSPTATRAYPAGQTWELFRIKIGGSIPNILQLVADNEDRVEPYYFTVGNAPADYTPYTGNPFVAATGSIGTFYWRNVYMAALPIMLQSFSGNVTNCKAMLEWVTATESNGKYFEVQRSVNGRDFEAVGTVASVGQSSSKHTYNFESALAAGVSYYRLKIVSADAADKYSDVIVLKGGNCFGAPELNVLVSPNPVLEHNIKMVVTAGMKDNVDITVLDVSGKLIGKYVRPVTVGKNNIEIKLPNVASTQYFVKINSPVNGTSVQKIFVE